MLISVSSLFDPLNGRSSLGNVCCLSVIFSSFVNVTRLLCVERHSFVVRDLCGHRVTGPLEMLYSLTTGFNDSLKYKYAFVSSNTRPKKLVQIHFDALSIFNSDFSNNMLGNIQSMNDVCVLRANFPMAIRKATVPTTVLL